MRTFDPDTPLELIVFSEIGYYFSAEELSRMASRLTSRLVPGGEFLAAHWLGSSPDHMLRGDEVHEILGRSADLLPLRSEHHQGFRLNSWTRQ